MSYFNIDILNPSQVFEKDLPAEALFIPTVKGEINVLPEHTHIVSKLDIGVLTLKTNEGKKSYVVAGGVCKVLHKKVTVLASSCERIEDIDVEAAQENLKDAQAKLSGKQNLTPENFLKLESQYRLAQVQIRAAAEK